MTRYRTGDSTSEAESESSEEGDGGGLGDGGVRLEAGDKTAPLTTSGSFQQACTVTCPTSVANISSSSDKLLARIRKCEPVAYNGEGSARLASLGVPIA